MHETSRQEADVTWANDGSTSAASKGHRERGLWAIDTTNPNAWGGLTEYMGASTADLMVGQETKVLAADKTEGEALLRNKGWKASLEPCGSTELDGRTAGVMVAVRKHIGMQLSHLQNHGAERLQA